MKALTVAEYKKDWFDRKMDELRGRGLNDTKIARQMGVGRSYLSQVVTTDKVGDAIIDRMCKSFGFQFPDPVVSSKDRTVVPAGTVTVSEDLFRDLVEQVKLQTRLLNALIQQQ